MTFEGCTFNISGKGVNVYVEAANADEGVTRTVAVNNCTVESTKENKAFLNIKNSTQSYDVTLSGTEHGERPYGQWHHRLRAVSGGNY